MVCKECIDMIDEYIEGTLTPEVMAELDEHFKDCPPCVSFFNTYKKTTHLCKTALDEVPVPDEVCSHMKKYLLESLSKRIKA